MSYKLTAQAARRERVWQESRAVAPVRAFEQRGASIESPSVPLSAANFVDFFGVGSGVELPRVTIDSALTVTAVWAAVSFLSRTLASIPLHHFGTKDGKAERKRGALADVIGAFWNDEQDAFKARQYFWQQVFTGGRGLAWIERQGAEVIGIWPMNPAQTTIRREGLRTVYVMGNTVYAASEVIDVPFMLRRDGLNHYGPVAQSAKAIQLAIAMNDYGSRFFAGGGVPPLALSGPLPNGKDALKRAMADVHHAIDAARQSEKPIFPMPPGHELKQVGFDPAKGQMTDARRFQIEEIARVYQLPPVFLQDLSRATFSNAEQQDLHLVKHLVGQWAAALEGEMNLKLFGRQRAASGGVAGEYVKHNLDGLLRGDFKTRAEAAAKLVQTGVYTPNKAAEYMGQEAHTDPAADGLYMQGAMVPLGYVPDSQKPVANKGGSNEE